MKKLASILGGFICVIIMSQPKQERNPQTINNYFIKSGCSGSCGGHCHGGGH